MAKIIVLDAGHGGTDPGANGFGIKEKDLTLDRILAIKKKLETEYDGVKIILTRSGDTYPTLTQRANIANNANADLFISDHKNSFNSSARGFETFTYTNASATSKAYQNVVHREIFGRIKKYGIPDRGQKSQNFAVLRQTKMPAVLLEEAFIDHKHDNELLSSNVFRQDYIDGVVTGIAKCLDLKQKEGAVGVANRTDAKIIFEGKNVAGFVEDGRTYVQVRDLANLTGLKINWDQKSKTVSLSK